MISEKKYSRRENLKHLLGAGAALSLSGFASSPAISETDMNNTETGAIDVHAHFVPSFYSEVAINAGHGHPDGMPGYPDWNAENMIAMMDKLSISRSILSISSPGVHFGDDQSARALAREVNEEAARAATKYPGRFGFFASLPLPDVGGSLSEIDYAFDKLNADGVVLESNHHGTYPGDAEFDPILDALNRRNAIVFVHPTSPNCSCGVGREGALPAPLLEFMFETTRMVTNLILERIPERFPDLRFIIPHGGAALPALVDRITLFSAAIPTLGAPAPEVAMRELGEFYYDLAGMPVPRQLPALRSFVADSQLLYGSDYPWTPEPAVGLLKALLEQHLSEETETLGAMLRGNAARLFALDTSHP